MGAVVDYPTGLGKSLVKGLAVDEDTALCVERNGIAKVHGSKYVYFASVDGAAANSEGKLTIYGNVAMNWYSVLDTGNTPLTFADAWSIDSTMVNYAAYSLSEGVLQLAAGNWPDTFDAP